MTLELPRGHDNPRLVVERLSATRSFGGEDGVRRVQRQSPAMAGNRGRWGVSVWSAPRLAEASRWRQITMRNIILAPAIVIGCAVIGVIVGALYFAAVLGVPEWLAGTAIAAEDLGRRASFPAFAFGVPAGAVIGVRFVNALPDAEMTFTDFAALIVAALVALPCIVLPLYASAEPAFKVLVLMRPNGMATILGFLSMLGIGGLALGSNQAIGALGVRRVSPSR